MDEVGSLASFSSFTDLFEDDEVDAHCVMMDRPFGQTEIPADTQEILFLSAPERSWLDGLDIPPSVQRVEVAEWVHPAVYFSAPPLFQRRPVPLGVFKVHASTETGLLQAPCAAALEILGDDDLHTVLGRMTWQAGLRELGVGGRIDGALLRSLPAGLESLRLLDTHLSEDAFEVIRGHFLELTRLQLQWSTREAGDAAGLIPPGALLGLPQLGALTLSGNGCSASTLLSSLELPPATHTVVLEGLDCTGPASFEALARLMGRSPQVRDLTLTATGLKPLATVGRSEFSGVVVRRLDHV